MHKYLQKRRQNLFENLKKDSVTALLVVDPHNISYLTGITDLSHHEREAFVLVTPGKIHTFISRLRYPSVVPAAKDCAYYPLGSGKNLLEYFKEILSKNQKIIFQDDLKFSEYQRINKCFPLEYDSDRQYVLTSRLIKDDQEIQLMKQASHITALAWKAVEPKIHVGISEKEVVELLRMHQLELGGQGYPLGFEPIVAFGAHAAIPHHIPGDTKLKNNQVVLVDFGCRVSGYASDFTRTIWVGTPTPEFLKIEKYVITAYQKAMNQLRPGNYLSQVDQAVYDYFENQNVAKYFIHTSGHGLGLDIHESLTIYRQSNQKVKIRPGMTLTIEPGLYFENKFGYRYENTILITEDGYEVLTQTSSEKNKVN